MAVAGALIVWGVITGAPARQTRPQADPSNLPGNLSDLAKNAKKAKAPLLVYPAAVDLSALQLTQEQLAQLVGQFVSSLQVPDLRALAAAQLRSLKLPPLTANLDPERLEQLAAEFLAGKAGSDLQALLAGKSLDSLNATDMARALSPQVSSARTLQNRYLSSLDAAKLSVQQAKQAATGAARTAADEFDNLTGLPSGGNPGVDWRRYAEEALRN